MIRRNRPRFVTITGLDEKTDLGRVLELSQRYPVEWGVLRSWKLEGIARRYPHPESIAVIERMGVHNALSVRLATHLCGAMGREVLDGKSPDGVEWSVYDRVQINASQTDIDRSLRNVSRFAVTEQINPIVQWRHPFWPEENLVDPLYDCSGGRGELPAEWPDKPHSQSHFVGYAGGLSPENIVEEIRKIAGNSHNYWIDMESGVRTDEFLDLDKVEAVLSQIYGAEA